MYLQNRNRLTDIENKVMVTKGKGGINWEFGIRRYTLLYIKIDEQQGPTVEHRELYSLSCNSL